MKKIVFLPLDERPCNNMFPRYLYKDNINLVSPSMNILGSKKKEANVDELINFIYKETKDADAFVLSLDMLIYGGLLPSRIHYLDKKTLENRLNVLKKVKENNPNIKIYSFVLIMRCPDYSCSDEEPDYYELCGREIHKLGELEHKKKCNIEVDEKEIETLKEFITENNLNDFLNRRKNNIEFVKKAITLNKEGIIDRLVIPQDDATPYGYSSMDQAVVREHIEKEGMYFKVLMYPGADEAGLSLISRCLMELNGMCPKVYIKEAAENSLTIIPCYEDRPLGETVKYHIMSAGGMMVSSFSEADIVLCLTNHSKGMGESRLQHLRSIEYDCFRNIPELVEFMKYSISNNKPVILCDNGYANGGDLRLIKALDNEKLLDKVSAYAGWNTNGNTLGTCIAQGFLYLLNGRTNSHLSFLTLRYIEDGGYCSKVRFDVLDNYVEKLGYNNFDVKEMRGEIAKIVEGKLKEYVHESLSSIEEHIIINDCYMPWKRMFEVGLDISWKE